MESAKPRPRKPVKIPVRSEYVAKKKEEAATRVLPRLRTAGSVEVSHTPRTFPTPSRESAAAEEEAWLRNVTLARRATGFVSEDLRPEEQDPQWCKEKGDEFFRAGNFLGAISAYTHGISLSDRLPSLFANRAATHFALGNFNKCVSGLGFSCERLLVSPGADAASLRGQPAQPRQVHCAPRRRPRAPRYLNKAIDEMKAAARLLPDDEKIKKDVYDMERAWEQNPDSD
ncbi:hypothetical protein MSG28_004964 [Choristoneura fumiferana]|uniref:Uncharacterized protein n=1 Tax=Choristoneura fumiferana TaxID=7141 RepID=A0ACC0JP96_CHOFU|nr:hypothetical protein MSG28_004964 [Choristoneura fumiferana]